MGNGIPGKIDSSVCLPEDLAIAVHIEASGVVVICCFMDSILGMSLESTVQYLALSSI